MSAPKHNRKPDPLPKDPYQRFFVDALKQMFRTIGLKYSPEECSAENWFQKHTWTTAAEDRFRDWFRAEARKRFRMGRRKIDWELSMFLLNYGWKNRDYVPARLPDDPKDAHPVAAQADAARPAKGSDTVPW